MSEHAETETIRARGIVPLGDPETAYQRIDRNGNRMLFAEAILLDGTKKNIIAFDRPRGAHRFSCFVATDLIKAIEEHKQNGMPPTEFILRVRKMPQGINPRTKKPYSACYAVESFAISPFLRNKTNTQENSYHCPDQQEP